MDSSEGQKAINVQVAVRCRPPNTEERTQGHPTVVQCDSENKVVKVNSGPVGKKTNKVFTFDRVFGMYSTQREVFDSVVRPIVDEVLQGFNCTIFAYGQTGTGKTHTMEGNIHSEDDAGIVPRSVRCILEQLESTGAEFTIRVSFLELYNEELQDLLADKSSEEKKLRLCEDLKKGVVCQNLEEITVLTANDIFEILQKGIKQRQTAETLCNKNSSRSHSIFTLKIMIKETNVDGEEVIRNGQLNLVDLAGSECVGRSGAKNDRAREAGNINQSLLTLGRVITALVDHHGHIPYRDSKLTRLLQESLGGKAKTCIIATLSPSQLAVDETLSTLDYAHRAKSIKNMPQVNQRMTKKAVLKEYCAEIESLRTMLQLTREKNGIYLDPVQFANMEARIASQESQLQECESALKVRNEENNKLKQDNNDLLSQLEDIRNSLTTINQELDQTRIQLLEVETELTETKVELFATELVVGEQVGTEDQLSSHCMHLQTNVTERIDEIYKLHDKVNRAKDSETLQEETTSSFTLTLQTQINESIHDLNTYCLNSNAEAETLNQEVAILLNKGQEVCSTLTTSLDDALKVLIGDTEKAKDLMVGSCDEVSKTLVETRENVALNLTSLKSELSLWLEDVSVKMTEARTIMTQQQKQLLDFSAAITSNIQKYDSLVTNHATQLEKTIETLSAQVEEMKERSLTEAKEYEQKSLSKMQSYESTVQKKIATVEQKMKEMLADVLQETTSYLSQNKTSQQNFSSRFEESIQSYAMSFGESLSLTKSSMSDFVAQEATLSSEFAVFAETSIENIEKKRSAALANVSDVTDNIDAKKQLLDQCIVDINNRVNTNVSNMEERIKSTATVAGTMQVDVKTATEKMSDCSKSTITSFNDYLNQQGAQFQVKIEEHFNNVSSFSTQSETALKSQLQTTSAFYETYKSQILQKTGQTPTKTQYGVLQPINRTRDHQIIKTEARELHKKRTLENNGMIQSEESPVEQQPVKRVDSNKSEIVQGDENVDPQKPSATRDSFASNSSSEGSHTSNSIPVRTKSRSKKLPQRQNSSDDSVITN